MSARRSRLLLLVENADLGGILLIALQDYDLEWHTQTDSATDAFRRRSFDLAVVDLAFGGRPAGIEAIMEWRAGGAEFPIIALSELPQPGLAVAALRAGADDFLRKPFHHEELVARIRKLLDRRDVAVPVRKAGGALLGREAFAFGRATVTPDLLVQFPDGGRERIRPKQHGILKVFAERAGTLVMKEELMKLVWGSDVNGGGHSVNSYISSLRRLFQRHRIDFNRLVASEPKAGWRIDAKAAGKEPPAKS
jgi:DNA-binding response OmpR family regulator